MPGYRALALFRFMSCSAIREPRTFWGGSPFPLVGFASEPARRPCDRDQRGQGCAAPAGLDLDHGARRGRMIAAGDFLGVGFAKR
jgi:hypothetical protein